MNLYERHAVEMQKLVMEWVGRVVCHEDTIADVREEMRAWVGTDEGRLWSLALGALGCAKNLILDSVSAAKGELVVPGKGATWQPTGMSGRFAREPDAIAATQATIAMLNADVDMASDILVAHMRAGGPPALFGLAMVACATAASLLDPSLHFVHTQSTMS